MTSQDNLKGRRSVRLLLIRTVSLILVLLFTAGIGMLVGIVNTMPKWDSDKLYGMESSQVFDAQGKLASRLYAEENRTLVPYEKIPPDLINAFIATEDEDFEKHHGVNFKGILRAAFVDIITRSKSQGASTITQQLARNAFLTTTKSYERKIREIILAYQLERRYTKHEIMEMYLNKVFFGGGTYGVQAASYTFFGKDVSELSLPECALLAGLVQSPNRYYPYKYPERAKARQRTVLNRMVECGYLTDSEAEKAWNSPLKYEQKKASSPYLYGYYLDYVVAEATQILRDLGYKKPSSAIYREGLRIYTSMNPELQEYAETVYADPASFPKIKGKDGKEVESAMVVINHRTGEVVAMVGGRSYETRRGFNRAFQARRQPGSAFKPLVVYSPALEAGVMPYHVLVDEPVSFGSYSPENYDGTYSGPITMRDAVKRSVNIYAVKLANEVGIAKGLATAEKMGITTLVKSGPRSDDHLSTALGGISQGVSPLEMAAAYGTLGNGGVYIKPHAITRIVDSRGQTIYEHHTLRTRALKPTTAWLMTSLLKSVVYDARGTGHRAAVPGMPTAGKTGTTQFDKDAWFVGYTPYFSCAVWMGFDTEQSMHANYGGGYPATIFRKVMTLANKGQKAVEFERPEGIESTYICSKSGQLPSPDCPDTDVVEEYYTVDHPPQGTCTVHGASAGTGEVMVCPVSGLLATENCPGAVPLESGSQVPTETCNIHPGNPLGSSTSSTAAKTKVVTVCRDPRHHGKLYQANIPGPGQKGGCDPTNLEDVEVPIDEKVPHCSLPDHLLR